MNTEITDKVIFEGWVLYDADCPFRVRLAARFQDALARRSYALLPLQTPGIAEHLGLTETDLLAEMRLLKPDGTQFGGADALLEISRQFWWTSPLRLAARLPRALQILRLLYRWIAAHRPCSTGACTAHGSAARTQSRLVDRLPLLVLPGLALWPRTLVAPWIFMWTMALALYAGCKWLTYREATKFGASPGLRRTLGYLLAWPGMEAKEFLGPGTCLRNVECARPRAQQGKAEEAPANNHALGACGHRSARDGRTPEHGLQPRLREWAFAAGKTLFGSILLWCVARTVPSACPLLTGWIGMIGIIFMIHFGLFHLCSLVWRRSGVSATPVMQNPAGAASLADFWGKRWNSAFNELAFRFAYRPLRRRTTPAIAILMVFGLSGLIHELVISLPAGAGYGLPTAYFVLQGLGVTLERTRFGRKLGLGQGWRGRSFALAVTANPACWLFHPPFVRNVILPMLHALGAT